MHTQYELDDLTLNAYVDGQLDTEMERCVLRSMDGDPRIREQIYRLRRAKDWMRSGFCDAEPTRHVLDTRGGFRQRWGAGIAASLLACLIGAGGALVGYQVADNDAQVSKQLALHGDPTRVLLHLDESQPERFEAVLDYAETLLKDGERSGVQVEVIANAGGIELMRVGGSPYEERVKTLKRHYHNLQFIACANAIRHLESDGLDAALIDDVHTGATAVDHIVQRLQEGWTYRKVEKLPGI